MRKGKLSEPPEVKKPEQSAWMSQTREYRLITPLFGGGVEAGTPDPITAVRGASVRGQLRFWWRATRAGRYATLKELKEAEARLWGAASKAALVEIAVEVLEAGQDFSYQTQQGSSTEVGHFRSPYSYVAFPLQQDKGIVREGVRFQLRLQMPQQWQDAAETELFADTPANELAAALWAWECFGGVGARTRRGFGAIECVAVDKQPPIDRPTKDGAAAWIQANLEKHVFPGQSIAHVPCLRSKFVLLPLARDPVKVWEDLFQRLKRFRQQRPQHRRWMKPKHGEIKQVWMPGRNHWPEPDEIRRRTGDRANYTERLGPGKENVHDHRNDVSSTEAFPRSAFGLPIQFEFKDRQRGDPRGKNLLRGVIRDKQGKEHLIERLASPLILRPLHCTEGYIGLVLWLGGSQPPDELEINVTSGRRRGRWRLTALEAAQILEYDDRGNPLPGALMRDDHGQVSDDVIEGFFNYLRRNGGV